MQTSAWSRRSSRWSETTCSTISPTVRQPTRSSRVIAVLAICCARKATTSFEVACVVRVRPGPRHRLHPDAAVAAAQPAQLALDDAAVRANVEMPPALVAPVVDLEPAAGLAASRADPPASAQPHRHDYALAGQAEVDHGRPGHQTRGSSAPRTRPLRPQLHP